MEMLLHSLPELKTFYLNYIARNLNELDAPCFQLIPNAFLLDFVKIYFNPPTLPDSTDQFVGDKKR
jgi:hypothetical protein